MTRRQGWGFAALIALAFFQLNLQVVLSGVLDIGTQGLNTDLRTSAWVLVVIGLWTLGIGSFFKSGRRTPLDVLLVAWTILLVLHAAGYWVRYGPVAAAVSFFSWGAWFPLLLWGRNQSTLDLGFYFAWLFTMGGLINALPALYEVFTGELIFKTVTIDRYNIQRYYGINQSVIWLGVQLGLGFIASLWLGMVTRRTRLARLLYCSAATQLLTMFLVGARGPILFTCVGLGFVLATARPKIWFRNLGIAVMFVPVIWLLFVLTVSGSGNDRLSYVRGAVAMQDESNMTRVNLWLDTLDRHILVDSVTLMFGHGAGHGSFVGRYTGIGELDTESSILKLLYDVGLLGVITFGGIWLSIFLTGLRGLRGPERLFHSCFLGMLITLTLEAFIAEPLKGWILVFYFWAILASIAQQRGGHGRVRRREGRTRPSVVQGRLS